MANPNLINTSSCLLEHNNYSLSSSPIAVAGSRVTVNNPYLNKVIKVVSFYVSNITTATYTVTVQYNNPGNLPRYIAYQVDVPAKSTLVLITKDSPVHLEEYQNLEAYSTGSNLLHASVNFEVYDDA